MNSYQPMSAEEFQAAIQRGHAIRSAEVTGLFKSAVAWLRHPFAQFGASGARTSGQLAHQ